MSSATDPLDTPHSDSDSERTLTASIPDYGSLPRFVHLTPLFLWANVVLLPWLLTTSYSLLLSNVHLAPPFLQARVLLLTRRMTKSYVMMTSNVFSHTRSLRICLNISFLSYCSVKGLVKAVLGSDDKETKPGFFCVLCRAELIRTLDLRRK